MTRAAWFSRGGGYGETLLLVSASLLVALAIDWLVAPWTYPVAAVYGISLLIAARRLSPRAVAACGMVALCLSAASNNVQHAPTWAWVSDDLGLLVIGCLALLLSRQHAAIEAARVDAERARQQQAFLADLNGRLIGSHTHEDRLQLFAQLAVPAIADWCIIDAVADDGSIGRAVAAHRDRTREAALRQCPPITAGAPNDPRSTSSVVRAMTPVIHDLTGELPADFAPGLCRLQAVGGGPPGSIMLIPLTAREQVLGIAVFGATAPRRYTQDDLRYATEVCQRAALSVDNARLLTETRRAADRTIRLQQVTAMLSAALTPEQVASIVMEQGATALGACGASVASVSDDGTRLKVLGSRGVPTQLVDAWQAFPGPTPLAMIEVQQTLAPIWLGSVERDAATYPLLAQSLPPFGIHACAVIPLSMGDRVLGSLSFGYATAQVFDDEDTSFTLALAQQCAQALERARLFEEQRHMIDRLQRLDTQLHTAERARMLTEERQRIARELHDQVQQTLFAIGLAARTAGGLHGEASLRICPTVLDDVRALAAQGMEQVRAAVFALSRAEVHDCTLVELLWALVADFRQRTELEADLVLTGTVRGLASDVVDVLHAVARETLANVERHARASAVVLSLAFDDDIVALTVQDDGVGASSLVLQNLSASTTHFGLRGLRDRLLPLGGALVAQPGVDSGFLVRARVPVSGGLD